MSERVLTPAARAAAMIRKNLKAQGLDVKVTSRNFSMGNSVDIHMTDQRPEIADLVRQYCGKFQYGHFDGMTDCYEYSNGNDGLPQAKFVHVSNSMSDAMRNAIYQHVRTDWGGGDTLPATYDEARSMLFHGVWMDQFVHRLFSQGDSTFWKKRPLRAVEAEPAAEEHDWLNDFNYVGSRHHY